MNDINLPEGILKEDTLVSLEELSIICQVEKPFIIELVEMGILEPQGCSMQQWHFSIIEMFRIKKAQRLQTDLQLNLAGIGVVLQLLEDAERMKEYIKSLEHRLKLMGYL